MIRVHLQLVCDKCGTPLNVTARFDWMASTRPDFRPMGPEVFVHERFSRWRIQNGQDVTCDNCVPQEAAVARG